MRNGCKLALLIKVYTPDNEKARQEQLNAKLLSSFLLFLYFYAFALSGRIKSMPSTQGVALDLELLGFQPDSTVLLVLFSLATIVNTFLATEVNHQSSQ